MENQQQNQYQNNLDLKIIGFSNKILHIHEAGKYELELENTISNTYFLQILSGLKTIKKQNNEEILLNGISIKEDKIVSKFIQKNSIFLTQNTFLNQNLTLKQNLKIISQMYKGYDLSEATIHSFMFQNIKNVKINKLSKDQKQILILSYVVCCPALLWFIDKNLIENLFQEQQQIFENVIKIRIKQGGVCIFFNCK